MNPVLLLCIVELATFGLVNLVLSGVLAALWWVRLERVCAAPLDLLSVRLLPAAGGLLVALIIALPAFVTYEPHRQHETAAPILIVLAAFGAICLAHGVWRGSKACRAANSVLKRCGLRCDKRMPGLRIVHGEQPLVGVIGAWHPHVIATESVKAACDAEEFREVLAHEAAHVAARDNLKLLLLIAAPDVLAWTPLAAKLAGHWRNAAECAADQYATGHDRSRRLALASALIKVARLFKGADRPFPALSMPIAADDVPARVLRLLGPPAMPLRAVILPILACCGLLLSVAAVPHYALLHELLEDLVGLGR